MPSSVVMPIYNTMGLGNIDRSVEMPQNNAPNSYSWLNNLFTGNRDYSRQWELLRAQNAYNAEQAQIGREFSERLSNSAYQRAVEDMRKAGLNPYLVYNNGGASTPNSYAASSAGVSSQNSGSGGMHLVNTVVNAAVSLANNAFGLAKSKNNLSAAKILGSIFGG